MALTLQKLNQIEAMLPSKFPNMSAQEKQAVSQIIMQKKAELLSQSNIAPENIPTDPLQRQVFEQQIQGGTYKPKQTSEQVKKSDSYNASTNLIDQLEKEYTESGGGTFGIGPGARIKGSAESLKGKVGLNDPANVYNRSKAGFAATLKGLTGDVGVLTDKDYARLAGLLPDLGSTKGESEKLFNNLRSQMAGKFGGEKTKTTFKPIRENQRGAIASLADVIFPSAVDYAEKGLQGQLAVQQKPMSLTDILSSGAGPLGMLATRPDVFKQTIGPAVEGAIGIQGAQALSPLKGGLSKVLNIKGALGQARKEAAAGTSVKISTNPIVEAGKKYISTDPEAKSFINTILKPLEKTKELTPVDLLDRIKVWNQAYTAAGRVGHSAKAGFYDALAKAAKTEIKEKAPEVAKYTKLLDLTYKGPKFAQKTMTTALKLTGLGRLLGL